MRQKVFAGGKNRGWFVIGTGLGRRWQGGRRGKGLAERLLGK